MKRIRLALVLVWLLSLAGGVSLASDIIVPSVSTLIKKADTIVSGTIKVDEFQKPMIAVGEIIKGDCNSGEQIELKLTDAQWGFSLGKFLRPYQGHRVVVLGHYDRSTHVLELPWYISTIMPFGYKAGEFPSETYAQCKEFVEAMLMYERIGGVDKEALIDILLNDIQVPQKRCAVLCFSGDMLSVALNDKELERELLAVFMAEIAAPRPGDPNGIVEACVVNDIARLMPVLPPSICASYLANVSMHKEHP